MNINKRLKAISKYVDKDSNIIDVGCDHALLPIYLILNNKCNMAFASDINIKPLEQAKKNIDYYNLSNKIKVKLGYGISSIDDSIDTIIISGMGGKNIIDILEKDINKLDSVKKIILSPNNNSDVIREELKNIGFGIALEEIVLEKNKFYPIIVLEKGIKKYNSFQIKFGYNIIKNDVLVKYYDYLTNKYNYILKNIPKEQKKEIEIIKKNIEYLKTNN